MQVPSLPAFLGLLAIVSTLSADDWPAYRADGHRSAVSEENIPAKLFASWIFQPRHAPRTAWPMPGEEMPRMHEDRAYPAVVAGGLLYFGNNVDNHVYALDAKSGKRVWDFAADGSVRFAPTVSNGRIYFGSDDGHVYCLDAPRGKLIWKYRAGPSGERIIGRSRMVSVWPVRTGLLLEDGVVYCAAGSFPYEGLYIAALDAKTGKAKWVNDTVGDQAWGLHYGGVSPHGYIVASGDTLFIPTGRSMPAKFDKQTGKFDKVLSHGGKIGGSFTMINDGRLYAGNNNQGTDTKIAYDATSGSRRGDLFSRYPSIDLVLTDGTAYIATLRGIYAIDRAANTKADQRVPGLEKQSADLAKKIKGIRERHKAARNKPEEFKKLTEELTQAAAKLSDVNQEKDALNAARVKWFAAREDVGPLALAGDTLFAGGKGFLISLETGTGKVVADEKITGGVLSLAIANGRVYASTDTTGAIHCFGSEQISGGPVVHRQKVTPPKASGLSPMIEKSGVNVGWCLIAGARDGRLAEQLAATTKLTMVVVEHDKQRLAAIRTRLRQAGLLGDRVIAVDWPYADLPDYFANLIVSERAMLGDEVDLPVDELARVLRPAGGQLLLGSIEDWPLQSVQKIANGLKANARAKTDLQLTKEWLHFTRGQLNGAAAWTGLYGNTANTSSTPDQLVKGPLGVLWYGEPGSKNMVGRHARSVSPLAVNGRLFMQGTEVVMAYDAYNGTFLWERKIEGAVRVRVDVDGSNITATDEALFVAVKDHVLQLDAKTGKTLRKYTIPRKADDKDLRWGYVAVEGNVLLGTGAERLDQEYRYFWNVLNKGGEWVSEEDCPKDALKMLRDLKANFPKPNERALHHFKRRDLNWRSVNSNWPNWLPDHNPSAVNEKVIMTSEKVFAYDITTGKLLWEHAGKAIPNISLVLGEGRVYFLKDDLDAREEAQAKAATEASVAAGVFVQDREKEMKESDRDYRRVMCLDVKSGRLIWSRPYDLTGSGGTKLGLAYQSGKLLAFGHYSNHDEGPFNKGGLNWRRITVIDGGGGSLMWSKPLNYRRRPTIVGDTIYIEPRRCDLATGEIQQRKHPITGEPVDWEFLRPGHSCGIVTATPHNLFFRSFSGAIVNTENDSGLQLFGGLRPGCWNSMIPANGLLSMQEGSAGCTCSSSLRTTVVLKNKPQKGHAEWAVFISQAATKPVSHMAINFGAPGDMRDRDGTVWFGYPRPSTSVGQGSFRNYGIKFNLAEAGNIEVIQRDWRDVKFADTDKPWIFTSGLKGVTKFSVPLLDKGAKANYTVRLGFTPLAGDAAGSRVFDVRLQGKTVMQNFDVAKAAPAGTAVVRELKGVEVTENLVVELTPPGMKGAAVIDVHPKLHHLGDNVVAAWTESTPKPEGFVLTIPFEFKGGDEAQTLSIAQQDVNNDWLIVLNDREIGRLRKDVAKLTVRVPVPKGVLREGGNELVIRPPGKSNDDIQVGRVQLFAGHPASTIIQSLEIIREDKKTAAKR